MKQRRRLGTGHNRSLAFGSRALAQEPVADSWWLLEPLPGSFIRPR